MKKIGIFGGSFDPVHNGHLMLAEGLRDAAGLDKIVFMPAAVSPFKGTGSKASTEDRLNMLKLAVKGSSGFEVSDYELKKGGISYTIETLEAYERENPDCEVYFLIGSDSFLSIDRWFRAGDLLDGHGLIVALRKGYGEDEFYSKLEEIRSSHRSMKIKVYNIPETELSSTAVRNRARLLGSVRYLVPAEVEAYMESRGLYRDYLTELAEYTKEHVSRHRFSHCAGVANTAAEYAQICGADPEKALTAGIFHDACKESVGGLEHGPAAAELLKERFGISDPDILNAIRYHTTGRAFMSPLEKAVKLADLLEPGRDYPDAQYLRGVLKSRGADAALLELIESQNRVLVRDGKTPAADSLKAISWLREITDRSGNDK